MSDMVEVKFVGGPMHGTIKRLESSVRNYSLPGVTSKSAQRGWHSYHKVSATRFEYCGHSEKAFGADLGWNDVTLRGGPFCGERVSVSARARTIDLPARNDRGYEKITYRQASPGSTIFVHSPEAIRDGVRHIPDDDFFAEYCTADVKQAYRNKWLEGEFVDPEPEGIEHPAAAALLIEIPATNAWGQLTDFSFGRALPEDVA
jgi:hypothetical protein